jgi:aspartate carbamoyltransferase regulatory subunit
MGKKDIIKIEGYTDFDFDVLGVIDPNITINIIKDGAIVEKRKLNLPQRVTNIIRCKNPRCITSIEQELPHRFKLTDRAKAVYRCEYCEQSFKQHK